jgi:hypothetical protein
MRMSLIHAIQAIAASLLDRPVQAKAEVPLSLRESEAEVMRRDWKVLGGDMHTAWNQTTDVEPSRPKAEAKRSTS